MPKCAEQQWVHRDSKAGGASVPAHSEAVEAGSVDSPPANLAATRGTAHACAPVCAPNGDVETSLATAIERAAEAGAWDAVIALTTELRERRLARDGVAVLRAERRQDASQEPKVPEGVEVASRSTGGRRGGR